MSRVIAHDKIYDEIVERARELAHSIDVAPGMEQRVFGANMSAMISKQQRDRAANMCRQAERDGAVVVSGGSEINRPGWFFQPTVLKDVTPNLPISKEEIFGPVLSLMRFKDEDEAINITNSTDYGLVSGVFTTDIDLAMRAAKKIRAGQVFVNEWYAGGVETPFGGYGKSGYGREKGREALWNYVQTKNIAVALKANSANGKR